LHRYVVFVKYSDQAIKAMIDTPQDRVAIATKLTEAFGGKLETTYGFPMGGEWDIMIIQQFPDDVAVEAVNFVLRATGNFVKTQAIPIMTVQEIEQSLAKARSTRSTYTAPTATK
jgi:uncharacterized protein with GYD domain